MNENFEKIKGRLGDAEVLAQLAEECTELAQAALKLRRALDGKNPTPNTEEERRRALLEDIQAAVENEGMGSMVAGALKRYVKRVTAADVAPVVHGQWVDNGIPDSILNGCSVCGFTCGSSSFFYCPICGAKMDESDESEN